MEKTQWCYKWFVDNHMDTKIFDTLEETLRDREEYLILTGGCEQIMGIIYIKDESKILPTPLTFS